MKRSLLFGFLFLILCLLVGHYILNSPETNTESTASNRSARQEVAFKTEQLQSAPAPVFEKEHTKVTSIAYDGMQLTLYQLPGDDNYYLYMTLAGTNYDLGIVGTRDSNIDRMRESMVQKTSISAAEAVYALRREESFDILTTTYFTIRENTPILLYSLPGTGNQYDVDEDGEVETISNGGLSTSPNYLLYEWKVDAGEVCVADLREQLSCDTLVFHGEDGCFAADKKIGSEWFSSKYQYDGAYLEKVG